MAPAVPRPRRETLPLLDAEWEWKSFERFCVRFVRAQSDVLQANLYGKRGEGQKGIDIVAALTDGRTRTYQCRRYKRFTPEQAKKTVEEHKYKGDEHVIMIACEASAALRDWEQDKAGWSVQDAEDLSAAVRDAFPRQLARELVEDTFGPDVRREFLGPPGPLAFLSPERFFAPYLEPGRLLHHSAALAGRADELAGLKEAATRARVVLLPGAGGAGKTRLLRQLAETLAADGVTVLMAAEAVELTAELVDDLPREPVCVVVDDAHRRDDLRPLFAHARRTESPVTLVLAARPLEVSRIEADGRHAGFDGTEITRLAPLAAMAPAALQAIARELLGDDAGLRARELAKVSDGSPLLCVIGGELLARDGISAAALRVMDEFREEVLGRYGDELLGRVSDRLEPAVARGILQALAALGPVSVENDEFIAGLAGMLGANAPAIVAALGELQTAGLLVAGGRLRRVTPDVLADRLLAEAALDGQGQPTGYLDDLYARFGESHLERLLKNGALLDWQVRRGTGRLLDRVWRALTAEFDRSGAFERSRLVERLHAVAPLQPRQALAFARHAISADTPTEPYSTFSDFVTGQADVNDAAVQLLEGVALHPETWNEVMPLLWQLGSRDERPLPQTPRHPLRVLSSLGNYGRRRPDPAALLRFVERLIRFGADRDAAAPAIALLRPLLAREVERLEAVGPREVGTAAGAVSPELTRSVRNRARELLVERARSGDTREQLLAVEMLTSAMRERYGLYGRLVSDAELDGWHDDQLETIQAVEQVFENVDQPLVRNRIRHGVRWHVDHSRWPEVAERCRRLVAAPASLDERLLAEMVEGWHDPAGIDEMQQRRRRVADELVATMPEGRPIAECVHELLVGAQEAGLRHHAQVFVSVLTGGHPEICREAADWILEQPSSPLDGSLAAFLGGLRTTDDQAAAALARRLADQSPERRISLATYLTGPGPLTAPSEQEQELFERVLRDQDPSVRSVAAIGLMRLVDWVDEPERTRALLLAFDPGGDADCAEHLAAAMTSFGVDRFSADELAVLLARFAPVPDLEYHAQRLLEQVGQARPEASMDVLFGRLDSASENDLSVLRFAAIPDRQLSSTVLNGAGSPREYRELVQRLRDAYPRLSGSARFALANGIWDLVGEPWVAFDVIAEWLVSDNEEERHAALALLGDMPWPLLFNLALPIALLLEELALNSPETATELTGELRGAGQTGSISVERYTTTQTLAIEVAQRLAGYPSAKALYDQIADDAADAIRESVQRDIEAEMLWWH